MSELKSKRLGFINSTPEIIDLILQGNEPLAAHLGVQVPGKWSEFGLEPFSSQKSLIRSHKIMLRAKCSGNVDLSL